MARHDNMTPYSVVVAINAAVFLTTPFSAL